MLQPSNLGEWREPPPSHTEQFCEAKPRVRSTSAPRVLTRGVRSGGNGWGLKYNERPHKHSEHIKEGWLSVARSGWILCVSESDCPYRTERCLVPPTSNLCVVWLGLIHFSIVSFYLLCYSVALFLFPILLWTCLRDAIEKRNTTSCNSSRDSI